MLHPRTRPSRSSRLSFAAEATTDEDRLPDQSAVLYLAESLLYLSLPGTLDPGIQEMSGIGLDGPAVANPLEMIAEDPAGRILPSAGRAAAAAAGQVVQNGSPGKMRPRIFFM